MAVRNVDGQHVLSMYFFFYIFDRGSVAKLTGSMFCLCIFVFYNFDRWSDVKSVNAVQINVGKMSDTQLLEELRSDPNVYAAITSQMPEFEKISSTAEED